MQSSLRAREIVGDVFGWIVELVSKFFGLIFVKKPIQPTPEPVPPPTPVPIPPTPIPPTPIPPTPIPPIPPIPRPSGPRIMYDSTNLFDIPLSARMVAYYGDGRYAASGDAFAYHAGAQMVEIVVFAQTRGGHVLDIETGNASPEEAVAWVQDRRAEGRDPSVYMNASTWPSVRAAFERARVKPPHYWVADWDGNGDPASIPAGAVAKQYANPTITGAHYDLSVVADHWPGVD